MYRYCDSPWRQDAARVMGTTEVLATASACLYKAHALPSHSPSLHTGRCPRDGQHGAVPAHGSGQRRHQEGRHLRSLTLRGVGGGIAGGAAKQQELEPVGPEEPVVSREVWGIFARASIIHGRKVGAGTVVSHG